MSFTLPFQIIRLIQNLTGIPLEQTLQTGITKGFETITGDDRAGISGNAKAALAAVLGVAALGTLGVGAAARELSHTRISYTEGETKSFIGSRKGMSLLAGLGLAGLVGSLLLLPPKTAEERQSEGFQWQDPWVKTKGIDVVIFGSGGTATPGGYTGGGGIPPSGPAGGPPTKPPLP